MDIQPPSDTPYQIDGDGLTDRQLVQAIVQDQAEYDELVQRTPRPKRLTAARFYAAIVSEAFCADEQTLDCEVCGLPGDPVVLSWQAILPRWGEHVLKTTILLPIIFIILIIGGLIPGFHAGADYVQFETHHRLCRGCKPGTSRRAMVVLIRGVICLTCLAALAVLIFTGAVLICWMVGAFEIGSGFALTVLPLFALSAAILLSLLTRWPQRLERMILLPPHLRRIARGPFGPEDVAESFRLTT